ncbi:sensor histidine kinase [Fusibacter ferrireducens]|uniref:histidine kinase n=1 Tax=Fusibacter ferrireducens TaxID=2785058 RepID=A0ABR9ZP60_9FIRM|nr:HAMP domain-containing sensor histidine kinase [Fusibacter ferrireducens]MBF4692219.1 HAMP domain-containing histidine kinase [Fusibacter ferrireducens]
MKKRALSIQIWYWFIVIIIGFSICLSTVFYVSLERYFKEQIYTQIEAQHINQMVLTDHLKGEANFSEFEITPSFKLSDSQVITEAPLEITNIVVSPNSNKGDDIGESSGPDIESGTNLEREIVKLGDAQQLKIQRYEKIIDGEREMAVIFKMNIDGQPYYLYSSVKEDFKYLILSRFWIVFVSIVILSILLLIPSKMIANKISRPLAVLEKDMYRIANRDWEDPIKVDGPFEIENLSKSCEMMRRELVQHDNNQQFFMQSISHELKTPIMVIRSYLQAIRDGYYPKGTIEDTVDTIDREAVRLQKRTADLISITNIDYMARQSLPTEPVQLERLIIEIYDLLKYERHDVDWHFQMHGETVRGHYELWKMVFENILQNQLRYSQSTIDIQLSNDEKNITIAISNDGPSIEEIHLDKLFTAFSKGADGQNGLGLYIVKRIVDLYQGEVYARNKERGVEFVMVIPNNE